MPRPCSAGTWDSRTTKPRKKPYSGFRDFVFSWFRVFVSLLLLLLLCGRLLGPEDRRRFRGDPVDEVLGFHEAARVRARAEDDDRDFLAALREPEERRQAVARLGDEPRLARADIDVLTAEQMVRAVEGHSSTVRRVHRELVGPHDRGNPLVA